MELKMGCRHVRGGGDIFDKGAVSRLRTMKLEQWTLKANNTAMLRYVGEDFGFLFVVSMNKGLRMNPWLDMGYNPQPDSATRNFNV